MRSNSSLEEEIEFPSNSGLEEEIVIPIRSLQKGIGNIQEEIEAQFEPGGRNYLGPGKKSLRAQEEIT